MDPQRPQASPWRDLFVVTLVTVGVALLAAAINLSEHVALRTRGLEGWQLDELPFVLLTLAASLMVVAERRRRQLSRELQARQEAEAELAAALSANRELSSEHVRGQEAERRRLARELHDELGQYLNAIKLDAVSLRQGLSSSEDVQAASQRITASVDHVHAAVGDMIGRLRPAALDDLGLAAALEACVDAWRQRLPRASLRLALEGDLEDLGEVLNVAVFRLVQEALTNAVRHSGSGDISLAVRRAASASGHEALCIRVVDHGCGADPSALRRGFGLRGMRERVEGLKGRLQITTAPSEGFALEVELPVDGAA
jgi:signal transduction histidine kinase